MIESIKFGPEWLRNTVAPATSGGGSSNDGDHQQSSGGNNGGGGQSQSQNGANVTKYPLAEFRYYREEMLSLFDINVKLPEILPKFKKLFVEKVQFPLAFSPPTEEEAGGTWPANRSLTGPNIPGRGGRGGGRGGSVDRGRGRERGIYHYTRSTSLYDDDPRGAGRGERTWLERNKSGPLGLVGETLELPNSTSPRKEYGSYGRVASNESWRRNRNDEEDWRSSANINRNEKWTRSTSWRNEDDTSASGESRSFNSSGGNSAPNERNKLLNSTGYSKKTWGDHDDNLPAWATENPSDYGGSFDASGAFHDAEEDENQYQLRMQQRRREHQQQLQQQSQGQKLEEEEGDISPLKEGASKDGDGEKSEDQQESNSSESMNDMHEIEASIKQMSVNNSKNLKNETQSNKTENIRSDDLEPKVQDYESNHLEKQQKQQAKNVSNDLSASTGNSADDRLQQVADDMLSKIFVDDDGVVGNELGTQSSQSNSHHHLQQPNLDISASVPSSDLLWFYRDPQGKIQGPFSAGEMSEWYRAGYFDNSLLIRRANDTRYTTLGDLVKLSAGVGRANSPFLAASVTHHLLPNDLATSNPEMLVNNSTAAVNSFHHHMMAPPASQSQTQQSANPLQMSNNLIAPQPQQAAVPSDNYQMKLQYQMMQKQYLLRQHALLIQKLATQEQWHLLTPEQQTSMVNYHMSQLVLPEHLFQTLPTQQQSQQQVPTPTSPATMLLNNIQGISNASSSAASAFQSSTFKTNVQVTTPSTIQQQMLPSNKPFMQQQQKDFGSDSINSFNLLPSQNHQIHQQQQQSSQQQNMADNKIKSLIMQLSMNPIQQQQHATFLHQQQQPSNSEWLKQQQQQPRHNSAWSTGAGSSVMNNNGNGNNAQLSMWDIPTLPTNLLHHQQPSSSSQLQQQHPQQPIMKTEQQIIDEQMLNQLKETAASHKEMLDDTILPQQQSSYQQQSALLQQHHQLPQQSQQHQQQQQILQKDDKKIQLQQQHTVKEEQQQPKMVAKIMKNKIIDEKVAINKKELSKSSVDVEDDSNWKKKEGGEEKKKSKELKKLQQLEEEKRKQLVDEQKRKLDEKKKQDQEQMLEQQKKAKMLEQQRREAKMLEQQQQQQSSHQKSGKQQSSAWNTATAHQQGLSLGEIQKMERERRAAEKKVEQQQFKLQQQQHHQQMLEQQQKENVLKWNAQPMQQTNIKSFEEIQAEEIAKATAAERKRDREIASMAKQMAKDNEKIQSVGSIWNSHTPYSNLVWNNDTNQQTSSGGFWEEPTKSTPLSSGNNASAKNNPQKLSKSQTLGNIVTNKTAAAIVAANTPTVKPQKQQQQPQKVKTTLNFQSGGQNNQTFAAATSSNQQQHINNKAKPSNSEGGNHRNKNNGSGNGNDKNFNEFTEWCMKTLSGIEINIVDVPTFIVFLQDIESPFEVKDYIKMYLGETKDCAEFAKQFLERRSQYKNKQRAQVHVDDMCSPAPAINPQSNEFQEVKVRPKFSKKYH